MNEMPAKLRDRAARKSSKRDEKKRLIADSAIEALQELGYANTSLRDIAAKSDLSLGMLHYYFEDRSDLIIHCVRKYKQEFVRDVITALDDAAGREAVIETFARALANSITDNAGMHRLWYDIRNQAMFDETFRPVVQEIERKLIRLVERAFERAGHTNLAAPDQYYALLDGVFRYQLQASFVGTGASQEVLETTFKELLKQFL